MLDLKVPDIRINFKNAQFGIRVRTVQLDESLEQLKKNLNTLALVIVETA